MNHGGNVWRSGPPGRWLDFSANLRPGGPPEWVREALRVGLDAAAYYPDPGMRAAREALGRYLGVDSEWVLPTAGGISAIDLAAGLPAPGMRTFSPCFGEYAQLAANRGREVRTLPLLSGRTLRRPAEVLRDADCAVWLCNPLNPVGAAFPRTEIAALLGAVEAAGGWLVIDEAFIHCCPEHSSVGLLSAHPRLVILGSLTKSLGIPGVRAGYLCAHPDVLRMLAERQLTWELSCFANSVIRELPKHAAQLRTESARNAARREELRRGLKSLGAFVYPSAANFLLADLGTDAAPVAEGLRERGILVRECMDFQGIDDGRHLRLAVKDEAANARLIGELREVLRCAESR